MVGVWSCYTGQPAHHPLSLIYCGEELEERVSDTHWASVSNTSGFLCDGARETRVCLILCVKWVKLESEPVLPGECGFSVHKGKRRVQVCGLLFGYSGDVFRACRFERTLTGRVQRGGRGRSAQACPKLAVLALTDGCVRFCSDGCVRFCSDGCVRFCSQVDPKFLRNMRFAKKHNKKRSHIKADA